VANKRLKLEEIVSKLRQVGVLTGQGMARLDAIRQIGVAGQTYYRWRKQYNTKRTHSALGYRPPVPETIIPTQTRPIMHSQTNWTGQIGLLTRSQL